MATLTGYKSGIVNYAISDVDDTAKNRLGTRAFDTAGNEYIYLQGVANTVVGWWVNFDVADDYTTQLVDTDTAATLVGRIAIAMGVTVANKYGWYAIHGTKIPGLSLTAATDTKNAYATSTGGSVDDSGAGAEALIFGAFYVSAVDTPSAGLAYFALNYPFMTGLTLD